MGNSDRPELSAIALVGLICAFLFPPAGILLSLYALLDISRSEGKLTGAGIALGGLLLSIISLVGYLFLFHAFNTSFPGR